MQTKTYNSFFSGKKKLRELAVKTGDELVLELFAGEGLLWNNIQKKYPKIKRTQIEIKKDRNSNAIQGDNLKIILSLDIKQYQIIDIDAYGIPVKQIEYIMNNCNEGTAIIITSIKNKIGVIPNKIYEDCGINKDMVKKCPTLLATLYPDIFFGWLSKFGIKKMYKLCVDNPLKIYILVYK